MKHSYDSLGRVGLMRSLRKMEERQKFEDTFPEHFNKTRSGRHNELIAAGFLMSCGFNVYLPYTGRGVDMIAVDRDGNRYGVEVRTSWGSTEHGYSVKVEDRDYGRTDFYIGVVNFSLCVIFDKEGKQIAYDNGKFDFGRIKHG